MAIRVVSRYEDTPKDSFWIRQKIHQKVRRDVPIAGSNQFANWFGAEWYHTCLVKSFPQTQEPNMLSPNSGQWQDEYAQWTLSYLQNTKAKRMRRLRNKAWGRNKGIPRCYAALTHPSRPDIRRTAESDNETDRPQERGIPG